MDKIYFAITIGPIYKTMQLARKTREFWAASLLFSLLAKEICEQLKVNGVKEEDFLVPHPNIFNRKMVNIGLYLDRIICKADISIWENLEKNVIDKTLENLSVIVSKVTPDLTKDVLKSYFKIYSVIKEVEDNQPPLKDISNHLNTIELYNVEISKSDNDKFIKKFLENVNTEYDNKSKIKQHNNFLKNYFIEKDFNGEIRIPSITEISTKSLQKLIPFPKTSSLKDIFNKTLWKEKPEEKDLFKMLKASFGEQVKNYNKYICILQADGDKLGSTLIKKPAGDVENISKDLIEWGEKDALTLLLEYGALPIYIGGDDVLCFAPVNNGTKSIIELATELNITYCKKPSIEKINSSLSISIKIAYYKSPMFESYLDTFSLLNDVAKKHEKANSCCINLEKHSGQPHQFVFNFDEEYIHFIQPIYNSMTKDEKKKSFISSVFYKIRSNEQLIEIVSKDKERLWFFFENNFDEAKPENKKKNPMEYEYLKKIYEFLFYLFSKHGNKKINKKELYLATAELYSSLKIIRFIKGLDYDNE